MDALDAQYYAEHHDLGRCRFVKFQREVRFETRFPTVARTYESWRSLSPRRRFFLENVLPGSLLN